jgi:uncharacterized SAM-binding protein YcdF (DUF218 family)
MNVIVILGCHQREILNPRLNRGIEEYKNYVSNGYENSTYILVSGCGRNKEYEYMYNYVSNYIDKNKILIEDKSMNTFENLIFSIKILEDKFQNKPNYFTKINLIICSSSFHIKRIILLTKFIHKSNIEFKFIHTRETITEEQDKNELNNINRFLSHYASQIVQ